MGMKKHIANPDRLGTLPKFLSSLYQKVPFSIAACSGRNFAVYPAQALTPGHGPGTPRNFRHCARRLKMTNFDKNWRNCHGDEERHSKSLRFRDASQARLQFTRPVPWREGMGRVHREKSDTARFD